MPPRPNDDDDQDSFFSWKRLRDGDDEADEVSPMGVPTFGFAPIDSFAAKDYIGSMLRTPPLGVGSNGADIPDLETAARRKLKAAGLYGKTFTTPPIVPVRGEPIYEFDRAKPPSWKFPSSIPSVPVTILGDDTAFGPGGQSTPPTAPPEIADEATARPDNAGVDNSPAQPTIPSGTTPAPPSGLSSFFTPDDSPLGPNRPPSLDHPDARTGVALTAADILLKRGAEVLTQVAGGNREIVKQALDAAVAWISSVLPPEHQASVAKTGALARADAERRLDEREAAGRNAAVVRTLGERRAETERAHDEAMIAGEPAKLEETRRAALDAFRAERLARGDGHSEVNTAVRAREAELRRTSLRHRLAQRDDAGIDDLLANDPDAAAVAAADPAAARAAADDIRRLRREDPARAGEASIEREIERRRNSGLIQSEEDAARLRYALRLEAQAKRGIPEDQRRILTKDERARLATEYRQIESAEGKTAADVWLDAKTGAAASYAAQLRNELLGAPPTNQGAAPIDRTTHSAPRDDDVQAEPAQHRDHSDPGLVRRPPKDEAERTVRNEAFRKEAYERTKDIKPEDWQKRFDVIVEMAERDGFLPELVRTHLWSVFRARNPRISTDERLDAARTIAGLLRLFPAEAERHINKGERALIDEVVRLDDGGEIDPDRIIEQATRNVGYIDLSKYAALIAGSMAARRRRGLRSEDIGHENLQAALERHGITIERQVRYTMTDGDTVVDFRLRVGERGRILRLIENKTPKASWHGKQKAKQREAAEEEGVPIDLMRTDPVTKESLVNGESFRKYVREIVRDSRRRLR